MITRQNRDNGQKSTMMHFSAFYFLLRFCVCVCVEEKEEKTIKGKKKKKILFIVQAKTLLCLKEKRLT